MRTAKMFGNRRNSSAAAALFPPERGSRSMGISARQTYGGRS
jgi:hypothetical protein